MAHVTVTLGGGRESITAAAVDVDDPESVPDEDDAWMEIPADAQAALDDYWAENDAARVLEAQDSGFDPVEQPQQYWAVELAEPIHSDVQDAVQESGVFSKPLVDQWTDQEDEERLSGEESAASTEFAALLELARTPLEVPSHASVTDPTLVASLIEASPLTQLLAAHRETVEAATRLTK